MVSCDSVLAAADQRGWYQRRLLWLFVLPVCCYIPMACLSVLMQVTVPDHWCHVPGRPDHVPAERWRRLTVPREGLPDGTTTHSKCEMYLDVAENVDHFWATAANWTNNTTRASLNRTACPFGWEFDRSDFVETAPSAFLWVCQQGSHTTFLLSLATVGNLLGSIIFGALSDRVGRRLVFFLLVAALPVFSVIAVMVVDPVVFTAMRFLAALCYPVMYQLIFTLGMEFTGVSQRTFYAVVVSMAFTLGMCLLPLVAYLLNHWVHLGLATALPCLLLLPYLWFVDESPRWLLSRGRLTEAAAVLRRVASVNGARLDVVEQMLSAGMGDTKPAEAAAAAGGGLLDVFAGRLLRRKAAALTACWISNVIMYYGLMLNFSDMSGNLFLNFFLLSVVELPSNALALWVCSRFGRRPTQLFFFCLSGASLLGVIPLQFVPGSGHAVTSLLMLGKFCTSLTFVVLYLQSAELYPTCVRSVATGFSSLVGIGAGALTPYILQLARLHPSYPFVVFGVLGGLGALSVATLPETRDRPLPETLEDAEQE